MAKTRSGVRYQPYSSRATAGIATNASGEEVTLAPSSSNLPSTSATSSSYPSISNNHGEEPSETVSSFSSPLPTLGTDSSLSVSSAGPVRQNNTSSQHRHSYHHQGRTYHRRSARVRIQNAATNQNEVIVDNYSHRNHDNSNAASAQNSNNNSTDNQTEYNTINELSSLSPYQRVTRNLYRTGAVNDPDIDMDVFDTYARIRMGTMNMTVSMQKDQTVVFRFDSNPGLNFWSNSDTHPPIQPINSQSFPDLLPLPRLVERKIKGLASGASTYDINELNRIFNELQDISDSHPVALIMISILEALDKIPPTGQLDDIACLFTAESDASEIEELSSASCEDDSSEERENCSICLSALAKSFPLARLKACKHLFHAECLQSWHKVKYTCPLCRSHLSPLKVKLEYQSHSI